MAEIYTSSETASLGSLSPDAADHIHSVLADLGLTGTSGVAAQTDAHSATAEPADAAALSIPGESTPTAGHEGADPVAGILAGSGTVESEGHGASAVHADDFGSPIPSGAGDAAITGGAGDDSLSGGTAGGDHALVAAGGHDTLVGGTGMDTLWGSETSASLLVGGTEGSSAIHAGQAGGDTIQSSGGADTIYGGNATIYASGHSAVIHTDGDTVHATGDAAFIDGSASTHASQVDNYGAFTTILGGAGNDTIMLHDTGHGGGLVSGGAGDDHLAASPGGHDSLSGGAGDDYFLSYGFTDSVIGGDGSDHFAILGHGTGQDTLDGGAGFDTAYFEDRSYADAHLGHSGSTTLLSFDDGYHASLTGIEQLQFKDTVLAN